MKCASTAALLSQCHPIYDTLPGWNTNTRGITDYNLLPDNAKKFVKHISNLSEIPVIIISTGPNREETIVVRQ
jgi:adenylosuccinate synthase